MVKPPTIDHGFFQHLSIKKGGVILTKWVFAMNMEGFLVVFLEKVLTLGFCCWKIFGIQEFSFMNLGNQEHLLGNLLGYPREV